MAPFSASATAPAREQTFTNGTRLRLAGRPSPPVSPAHQYAVRLLRLRDSAPGTDALRDVFVAGEAKRWRAVADALGIEFAWCSHCERPASDGDTYEIADGSVVCDGCAVDYYVCCHCDRRDHMDVMYSAYDGERDICSDCRDEYYTFCEACDYHVRHGDEDHRHDCGCEAPRLEFSMPNNGYGVFANDQRITVATAKGQIDDVGMAAIERYLWTDVFQPLIDAQDGSSITAQQARAAANAVSALQPEWQTKDGNLTRRLARLLYREYLIKIPPGHLSEIGNIARRHSSDAADYHIELTRDLNLSAADFYHEDSCWWGSYSSSRCALKQCGGMALRSWDDHGDLDGRAWVIPLHQDAPGAFRATHDTPATAYVVFNGYGALEGYTPARLLAYLTSLTYRRLPQGCFTCSPMYVNGHSGYLVADAALCETTERIHLSVTVEH